MIPRRGVATLRDHLAVKIIVMRINRWGPNDYRMAIFIPRLDRLRKLVPPTRTIPTDTSQSSLILLQAAPNHTWMN